jgi:hypothetical protein
LYIYFIKPILASPPSTKESFGEKVPWGGGGGEGGGEGGGRREGGGGGSILGMTGHHRTLSDPLLAHLFTIMQSVTRDLDLYALPLWP